MIDFGENSRFFLNVKDKYDSREIVNIFGFVFIGFSVKNVVAYIYILAPTIVVE